MDIEKQLEAALRAQDPGPAFTRAVLARVNANAAPARSVSRWRLPASLAASVLLTLVGAWLIERQLQQDRIVLASQQLALALEITSEQLNQVQQKLSRNEAQENGI
jgi:ABC-type nickel/cobalt efflux system permease component RcnA